VGYESRLADTPQDLADIIEPLVDAGVDILDPSTRRFWDPAFAGSDLTLAGWTKKISGKPTSAVGAIGLQNVFSPYAPGATYASSMDASRLKQLAAMIEREEFDLALVGRALLSNPDWANKVQAGAFDQLRPFHAERGALLEPAED
jgi:2,4-dienoyl-CoA reductase-like NADH-dependent reductase (Old Yellow Enzyme family)